MSTPTVLWPVVLTMVVLGLSAPIVPSRAATIAREVTFLTSDGVQLAGTVFAGGKTGTVLAHMLRGNRKDLKMKFFRFLHRWPLILFIHFQP